MREHEKITFTRNYCKNHGIRYMIKGVNDALFLYSPITRKYCQVCYCLLNLNNNQIIDMIEKHIAIFLK